MREVICGYLIEGNANQARVYDLSRPFGSPMKILRLSTKLIGYPESWSAYEFCRYFATHCLLLGIPHISQFDNSENYKILGADGFRALSLV